LTYEEIYSRMTESTPGEVGLTKPEELDAIASHSNPQDGDVPPAEVYADEG